MKWLQDNPLGQGLLAVNGVFLLLVLGMSVVWNLPPSAETADSESGLAIDAGTEPADISVGDLDQYGVIVEKPVFNESRNQESVSSGEDELGDDDPTVEVTDAPEVRLTGVIITPSLKIASLTPVNGDQESVMAHEGQALTGEFVGWHVGTVGPRKVVLESRDGQSVDLELQVHDQKIKEPPKPVAAQVRELGEPADQINSSPDDEPLTRAEQIRQRIAERREELRREQEEQQRQNGGQASTERPLTGAEAYQNAMRNKIRNNRKDQASEDDKEK